MGLVRAIDGKAAGGGGWVHPGGQKRPGRWGMIRKTDWADRSDGCGGCNGFSLGVGRP